MLYRVATGPGKPKYGRASEMIFGKVPSNQFWIWNRATNFIQQTLGMANGPKRDGDIFPLMMYEYACIGAFLPVG